MFAYPLPEPGGLGGGLPLRIRLPGDFPGGGGVCEGGAIRQGDGTDGQAELAHQLAGFRQELNPS
ncbi:hypothetical protein, partial [Phenylobacterium sp.]|uniref:hypothetical protein n=1 Tax=Phenylobacterium sp. TaxID=1871053 RepID=UPI0025FDEC3D